MPLLKPFNKTVAQFSFFAWAIGLYLPLAQATPTLKNTDTFLLRDLPRGTQIQLKLNLAPKKQAYLFRKGSLVSSKASVLSDTPFECSIWIMNPTATKKPVDPTLFIVGSVVEKSAGAVSFSSEIDSPIKGGILCRMMVWNPKLKKYTILKSGRNQMSVKQFYETIGAQVQILLPNSSKK